MSVNKQETVDIIKDLVTLLVTELTGDGAWVDNSDGTFTMPLCRTYWLKAQDTITIDSVEYEVIDVVRDTSVTVNATSAPNGLTFFLDAPSFYHGTIIQTNQELSQDSKDVSERSPMAYLLRDLEETFFNDENLLDRETNIRLFFLHDTNFQDYTTELADEETLEPMRSMAYFFVEEVLKKSKLIARFDDYTIRDYLRFGRENASGYTDNIFNDNFSGVELSVTLPIKQKYPCECDDVNAKIKYIDSDGSLKSEDFGTTIVCTPASSGTVNVSNSDDTYSVDTSTDLELPDITHTDSDGSPVIKPAQTPFVATVCGSTESVLPIQTGQITSYQTGDDGGQGLGRLVDFYTLNSNNSFGNVSRFTNKDGKYFTNHDQTTYANGDLKDSTGTAINAPTWNDVLVEWGEITIDHAQNLMLSTDSNANFSTAITNVEALTKETYSDWHVINRNVGVNFMDDELNNVFGFAEYIAMDQQISPVSGNRWTSTTQKNNTATAFQITAGGSNNGEITNTAKTNVRAVVIYRIIT